MFQDGFPVALGNDVEKAVKLIPEYTYNNVSIGVLDYYTQYTVNGCLCRIPYRIYFIEPVEKTKNKLNEQQKMILNCIYSRSCNGFVREKNIAELLASKYEEWAIPYIVKVCEEYVVEILELVYHKLINESDDRIKKFCIENTGEFCKSYDRMTSYWYEYYRRNYSIFKDYVGYKLFHECFGFTKSMYRKQHNSLPPS